MNLAELTCTCSPGGVSNRTSKTAAGSGRTVRRKSLTAMRPFGSCAHGPPAAASPAVNSDSQSHAQVGFLRLNHHRSAWRGLYCGVAKPSRMYLRTVLGSSPVRLAIADTARPCPCNSRNFIHAFNLTTCSPTGIRHAGKVEQVKGWGEMQFAPAFTVQTGEIQTAEVGVLIRRSQSSWA